MCWNRDCEFNEPRIALITRIGLRLQPNCPHRARLGGLLPDSYLRSPSICNSSPPSLLGGAMPRALNDALCCEELWQSNAVAVRYLPTEQARWGRAALGAQGSHQAASHRDELGGDFWLRPPAALRSSCLCGAFNAAVLLMLTCQLRRVLPKSRSRP